jgi:hypothetical protein
VDRDHRHKMKVTQAGISIARPVKGLARLLSKRASLEYQARFNLKTIKVNSLHDILRANG